ncbi:hypothetical protein J5Y03_09155 [Bacillus sp. RG28]|uniref:Uncharacterized protein n=1 Tax=Gottfriedia endophytica TaxID=2820819 RepID=A0A940NNE7_9BACI|nr:hypothetical protein [Gottfriedia endophytica]MBP0725354.1 hypothetical protein [Gottfriedia endophytica]
MVKKIVLLLILLNFIPIKSVLATAIEKTVSGILTVQVTTIVNELEEKTFPIKNSRVIVINSLGKIIATSLTDSKGEVNIPVTVLRDNRFPMKNMGEVTVISVAEGYNEYINFSVPINEYFDKKGRVSMSLWKIDPNRRNEPLFSNGDFHRFTVFEILDYYAKELGLKRQKVNDPSIAPAPWGPQLVIN